MDRITMMPIPLAIQGFEQREISPTLNSSHLCVDTKQWHFETYNIVTDCPEKKCIVKIGQGNYCKIWLKAPLWTSLGDWVREIHIQMKGHITTWVQYGIRTTHFVSYRSWPYLFSVSSLFYRQMGLAAIKDNLSRFHTCPRLTAVQKLKNIQH